MARRYKTETRYQTCGHPLYHGEFSTRQEAEAHIAEIQARIDGAEALVGETGRWLKEHVAKLPPFINTYERKIAS